MQKIFEPTEAPQNGSGSTHVEHHLNVRGGCAFCAVVTSGGPQEFVCTGMCKNGVSQKEGAQ